MMSGAMDMFVLMMLAHFVGDYLFQNQWMAIGKSFAGRRGHIACTVHVLAYTLAFVLVARVYNEATGAYENFSAGDAGVTLGAGERQYRWLLVGSEAYLSKTAAVIKNIQWRKVR